VNPFYTAVYQIVRLIPKGRVMSYGSIARCIGAPRNARQVGTAMRMSQGGLPWHRVIRADGSIPSPVHPDLWRAMLEAEGVCFLPDGRVNMAVFNWPGPSSDQAPGSSTVEENS